MKYEKIKKAKFIERPNRFVAICEIDGERHRVHVKNTGRCRELLVPGVTVWLEDFEGRMGSRKMRYSLVCVEKKNGDRVRLVNMDSQAPNKVAKEALEEGLIDIECLSSREPVKIMSEKTYGDSRLDFCLEEASGRKTWIEVKGVTLENDNVVSFPDAPTERGAKHVRELIKIAKSGGHSGEDWAAILFVVQMENVEYFTPNADHDPDFANALVDAEKAGVEILAYDCKATPDSLKLGDKVKVCVSKSLSL
ncbi:MAG: DNA/RNA nuclease SfsA [Firmicutes bacterium]|nr:DNA/RNA nuclease SfsA [Bacillota bacterium]